VWDAIKARQYPLTCGQDVPRQHREPGLVIGRKYPSAEIEAEEGRADGEEDDKATP
jgi:hypothetical protein